MIITPRHIEFINNYIDRKISSVGKTTTKPSEVSFSGVFMKLANDDDEHIRRVVASNPNTPAEALEMLAEDEDLIVRESALKNPNYPR